MSTGKGGVIYGNNTGSKFLHDHTGLSETGIYLLHGILLAGPQHGQVGSGRNQKADQHGGSEPIFEWGGGERG